MIFIYPRELQPKDRLRIQDRETGDIFWEEVDSLTPKDDKVMVFTKARMVMCDAGSKVAVQRYAESSVGE